MIRLMALDWSLLGGLCKHEFPDIPDILDRLPQGTGKRTPVLRVRCQRPGRCSARAKRDGNREILQENASESQSDPANDGAELTPGRDGFSIGERPNGEQERKRTATIS